MVAALTTDQLLQVIVVCISALAALFALSNVLVNARNERRRSQPIVIAHEARARHFTESHQEGFWAADAYLTSEGSGPAFNVRFGVEFNGVRYPFRMTIEDPDAGNVQRVLRSSERRPEEGSWPILIDSMSIWGRASENEQPGQMDAGRIYWARYQNAEAQTWETRNPGDRSAKLDIRRVRWAKRVETREQRRREKAGRHNAEWIQAALAELRAGMGEADDSTQAPSDPNSD